MMVEMVHLYRSSTLHLHSLFCSSREDLVEYIPRDLSAPPVLLHAPAGKAVKCSAESASNRCSVLSVSLQLSAWSGLKDDRHHLLTSNVGNI